MYSRQQIDQVRSSVDIVETVREYVPSLKIAGRSVKGLCPFHAERTPSFHVQPDKGLYKCFGCGEGGDVFAFLAKIENLTFSEAVERVASQAGITLKKEKSRDAREPEGQREKILRVLEAAASYYEEKLWKDRSGEAVQAYLDERHVTEDTARAFRLGLAPQTGEPAFEALVKKGFAIETCQQAGLVSRSNAGRFYDPLYGRLIFPILDTFGHVVGFGGRILPKASRNSVLDIGKESDGNEGPKYINSPETPVFSKGKLMYGLFQAKNKIREQKRAMVLEGYMDVIGAHQAGFDFGVATLGTALTRDHAKLIKRYADQVLMFFDADEAGRKAAVKGLEPVLQEELFPKVVLTEETGDPDEIVHEKGQAFFSHLLESAPDFVDYLVSGTGERTLQEKAALAKHVLQLIAASPNEILKADWTRRLGRGLGVDVAVLEKELRSSGSKVKEMVPNLGFKSNVFLPSAEEEYLQLVLNVPGAAVWERLKADDFVEERQRRLVLLIEKQLAETGKITAAELYSEVAENDREWFMRLAMEDKTFEEPEDRREQLTRDIRWKRMRQRFSDLGERIKVGRGSSQEVEEFQELFKQIKGKVQ